MEELFKNLPNTLTGKLLKESDSFPSYCFITLVFCLFVLIYLSMVLLVTLCLAAADVTLSVIQQMPLEVPNKELSNSVLSLQPEPEVPPELPPPRMRCCWESEWSPTLPMRAHTNIHTHTQLTHAEYQSGHWGAAHSSTLESVTAEMHGLFKQAVLSSFDYSPVL